MEKVILSFAFLFSLNIFTFAQIVFEDHIIVEDEQAKISYSADLDGDGDEDIILAFNGKIVWYENTDGLGSFGNYQIITPYAANTSSIFVADVDADGDMDVLSASIYDDKIAWYKNIDGSGNFGNQQVITTFANQPQSVHAADLDGDGDLDVLSASSGDHKIAWYENEDGFGHFGDQQIIEDFSYLAQLVHASDIDGDGDIDVFFAGKEGLGWYENIDGLGTFISHQVFENLLTMEFFHMADLDSDGDMDFVLTAMNSTSKPVTRRIAWWENELGTFSFQGAIGNFESNYKISCYVTDIDNDGDNDVISSSYYSPIRIHENVNGSGVFIEHGVSVQNTYELVIASDLDSDGDVDLLSTAVNNNIVTWFENENGEGSFGDQQIIFNVLPLLNPNTIHAADLDSDGDLDVLSASSNDNKIAWFENEDGMGSFGDHQTITTDAVNATSVYATDLDGDGDLDVLSASYNDDKIAWYINEDGLGNFNNQQNISVNANGASSVYSIDIDNDGDLDVLSASYQDNKIAWYENGGDAFGNEQIITNNANGASAVYAIDLDGDGDMDVLSASFIDDKIAWYENTDGLGTFGDQQIISTNADGANSVTAKDLDGDGDMDVLSTSYGDNKIAWYKNEDGLGTFGNQEIIFENADGASSVTAADVDGDGSLDVIASSYLDEKISWFKNEDGLGDFGAQQFISINASGANSICTADLDGDNDIDIILSASIDNKIEWHENQGIDTEAPIVFCQNLSIDLNLDGEANINPLDIDDGTIDNGINLFYEINESNFTCDDIGTNNVKLIVTDIGDNSDSCEVIVTIVDNTQPIVLYQSLLLNLEGAPEISITIDDIDLGSYDNCGVAEKSLSQTSFTSPGEYVVVLTVTDFSDNVSTRNVNVKIVDDLEPPIANCQDITVELNENGSVNISALDLDNGSTDDFNIEFYGINQYVFYCNDIGANQITLTVTDELSNTDACSAIVTVVDYKIPTVNTQAITIDLAGQSSISITADQIDNGSLDNCEIISMTLDQDTFTEVGAYEVLFTATDAGNNSKSETVIVTVINSVVGVEDLNDFTKNLIIHPIPTTDQITIEAPNNISQINIYNTQGQLLISQNTNNVSVSNINLTNLATGLYFCEVKDSEGNVGVRKIIKK